MEVEKENDSIGAASEEVGSQKKRSAHADTEPGVLRLRLPVPISNQVREAIAELKLRGVNASPEELMAQFVGSLPENYLEGQVLQRTPEEFYIRAAIQIPELREKLARQARKALVKKSGIDQERLESPRRKKSGAARKENESEALAISQEVPA